jgi:hypothetical protein
MSDPVASPHEAHPVARRSPWPRVLAGLLALAVLGGVAYWLGDVPNRYRAAQEMRAGRVALLASDLPKALGFFRAAALLRPTDEAIIQQYDQTQTRWVEMVEQKLAKLDGTAAYLALQEIPATEPLLVEPHLGRFRARVAGIEAAARTVADGLLAQVREQTEAGEFDQAYATLKTVEPLRRVAPDLVAARQTIEQAQVAAALANAQAALEEEQFDAARDALKPVAELAAKNEDYARLGVTISETEVRAALRDARKELSAGKLKEATNLATRAASVGVLADEVAAARSEILQQARATASYELAVAISMNDRGKVEAALAQGESIAGWKKVPVDDLLQPASLAAFLETLNTFELGAEQQQQYVDRLDIPLVAWAESNIQDPAGVKEYFRDGYREWSRMLAQHKLSGSALFVDDLAVEFGAEPDEAWRKATLDLVVETVGVRVAVRNPAPDAEAPAKLDADATAALRAALAKKLGAWPKLVEYNEKDPATVVFFGYYGGFEADDYPTTTRKTVRYRSGTNQVPNPARDRVVDEYNDLMVRHNNVIRQIDDKNDYISSVENNPYATDWDRSQLVYRRIEVASDRNLIARWREELANLRRQAESMPRYIDEPVYADEAYDYIQHHYECDAVWSVVATIHGGQEVELAEHVASTTFDTDEVKGNASRGVPVKPAGAIPRAKLEATLARELVKKAAEVDELVKKLPELTLASFVNFHTEHKTSTFAQADQFLGLLYAWERFGRTLGMKAEILASARTGLNLPPKKSAR